MKILIVVLLTVMIVFAILWLVKKLDCILAARARKLALLGMYTLHLRETIGSQETYEDVVQMVGILEARHHRDKDEERRWEEDPYVQQQMRLYDLDPDRYTEIFREKMKELAKAEAR